MRPVEFNGKEKDFPYYMLKLQAQASQKKLLHTMEPVFDGELPAKESDVLDTTTDPSGKQAKAKEENAKMMSILVLGQKDHKMINLITLQKTTDWPRGKA